MEKMLGSPQWCYPHHSMPSTVSIAQPTVSEQRKNTCVYHLHTSYEKRIKTVQQQCCCEMCLQHTRIRMTTSWFAAVHFNHWTLLQQLHSEHKQSSLTIHSLLYTDRLILFTRWSKYVLSSNTWFLGPTQVCPPNGFSVAAIVSAGLTVMTTHRHTDLAIYRHVQQQPTTMHWVHTTRARNDNSRCVTSKHALLDFVRDYPGQPVPEK